MEEPAANKLSLCEGLTLSRAEFESLVLPREVVAEILKRKGIPYEEGDLNIERMSRSRLAQLRAVPELKALLDELWERYLQREELNEEGVLNQMKVGCTLERRDGAVQLHPALRRRPPPRRRDGRDTRRRFGAGGGARAEPRRGGEAHEGVREGRAGCGVARGGGGWIG